MINAVNCSPELLSDADLCARTIIDRLNGCVVLGLPLGLGKPAHVVNALYEIAKNDPLVTLDIFTALTLDPPSGTDFLSRRFSAHLRERLYRDYERIAFVDDRRRGTLPGNVRVAEFYLAPGELLSVAGAQMDYTSSNYTHVVRDLMARGVNAVAQLVAVSDHPDKRRFSLGSNPDLTLDLVDAATAAGRDLLTVGQVSRHMPFMPNDAEVPNTFFDLLLDSDAVQYPLFPVPDRPVSLQAVAIGLHTASLVADGGTLQIGIGSLGDAVAHALAMRQLQNEAFRGVIAQLITTGHESLRRSVAVETGRFDAGLFGSSEAFGYGFAVLRDAGVLIRQVHDSIPLMDWIDTHGQTVVPELLEYLVECDAIGSMLSETDVEFLRGTGVFRQDVHLDRGMLCVDAASPIPADLLDPAAATRINEMCLGELLRPGHYMEAAFFLGPSRFYDWLRALNDDEIDGIDMTRVSRINQLYGNEALRRRQRRHARFINEAMMVTLSGAVVADGLDDGRVVSGIGGQYNFVAMAHALSDARSIIVLPATRQSAGKVSSNIVWQYAHTSVPRHLRDIVVTEYGAADLRGLSDRDVIAALINISDSRFQRELLDKAIKAAKIEVDYEIPENFRQNEPERIDAILTQDGRAALFPFFPLGSEFSDVEARLVIALVYLKQQVGGLGDAIKLAARGGDIDDEVCALLGIDRATGVRARFYRRLVGAALAATRSQRPLRNE